MSKCTISLSIIPGEVIDVMLFCNSRVVLKSPIVVATVVRSETDAVAALLILVAIKVLSCSVLTVVLDARLVEVAMFAVEGVAELMALLFVVLLIVEIVINEVLVLGLVILLELGGLLVGGLSVMDMVFVISIDVVVRVVANVGEFVSSLTKSRINILILVSIY